ncbi:MULTISPECIES: alpha/beta fold hydrolase [Solibacillus]|uniref:Alpha/beta hydrolase n=1 Tax=Solibacillus merdavium TaxID=2762218 RepID=A0ABR8XJ57_9BACL|nr:hypothetical protein [Solibacillus merdavium]MBD8031971.1 hypothetical protein [Solibacillus merdavium]
MNYTDKFTNTGINIHYIETNDHVPDLLPLVYIPGALGNAEQFIEETKSFFPRHCISLNLRGRGKIGVQTLLTSSTILDVNYNVNSAIISMVSLSIN